MRLVRLAALIGVVAAVYFAQYLFDTTSLADFFPAWLLAWWPALGTLARWLPDDLLELAIWLSLLGLLSFGLLAPWWQGERGRVYRRLRRGRTVYRAWWWLAQVVLLLSFLSAGAVIWLEAQGDLPLLVLGVWLGSLVLFGLGGLIANRLRPPVVYGDTYLDSVRPWDGWPYWVVLLALFAVLYSYRLLDVPLRVDGTSARVGLAAQAWVRDFTMPQLAATPNDMPLPTIGLMALSRLIARDNLLALRAEGVAVALFLLTAVWLVGSELFRRVPVYGPYGEVLEDDGRWIALMAMIVVGVSLPMLHWSRVPLVLESAALGVFGLWALLRGLRRDRPGLLGLSALMLGWSIFYGALGLLLGGVALLIWCGVLLLESSWLTGKFLAHNRGGEAVPVQRGVGWRGFGYWLMGIVAVVAPLVSRWVTTPGSFVNQWTWPGSAIASQGSLIMDWRERLEMALLGLNHLPDATGTLRYDAHFVPSLLAPLLVLALGALLLNIDSLAGWTLTTWLMLGVVAVGMSVPVVPSWVAMVALLPAIGLAVAFVIDRLRLHIMTNAGTWTLQATVYLALGVIVTAGFMDWIHFYNVAQHDSDLASAVGRALRMVDEQPVVIVNANVSLDQVLGDPVVQLLAATRDDLAQIPTVNGRDWPSLSPGTRLLLAPGDSVLQEAMEAAYPSGVLTVMRDLNSNPVLFVYDLVDSVTLAE